MDNVISGTLPQVIAATLTMLVCVTFRVPYGFQRAIYALLISRETFVEDTL
jgi:hypothetical protein